jgi:PAS domain S-box-containing protein
VGGKRRAVRGHPGVHLNRQSNQLTGDKAGTPDPITNENADASRPRSLDERIFETTLDLILVVDRQGNFLRVSPSCMAILGYQPEEMIGRSAIDFVYPADLDNTRNEMRLARRGRSMRNFECRYVHRDGRIVPLVWTGVWYEPDQQHFFIGRDMTDWVKLEAQLRQAQKMDAIGQLTGGIAHDFNNILTTIISTSELLGDALADNPKLAELVKFIDEAGERGAELVRRLLAFARKQPLEARPVDLNDMVSRMVVILQRTLGEDIAVKAVLAEGLWSALADPSRLEDAILNLSVNARDAMPKGGRLVIETANVHLDEHYAAQNADVTPGDYVALIVTDSGTGMAPGVAERAFEPFFTTKSVGHGTGLGLSMVYGFAKQSRGHVKIYSEIGHGTSVKLYLPKVATAAAAVETHAPVPHVGGREAILLVEDDAAVRVVAVTILESLGYQVWQAEDGQAALAILKSSKPIDLLFSDLILPNAMSGQELLRQAREHRPGLKALFTSGYSASFIAARGEADETVPLLGKPYRKQKLAEAIRTVLDGGEFAGN